MESLDSTLETKRPAAALNLLSQQKKLQVAISSEGQYQTSILVLQIISQAVWLSGQGAGREMWRSRVEVPSWPLSWSCSR